MTRIVVAITSFAVLAASRAIAQQPGTPPGLRPLRFPGDTLRLDLPPALLGAGRLVWPRRAPAALARTWADSLRAALAVRAAARWRVALTGDTTLLAAAPGPPPELPAYQPVPAAAVQPQQTVLQRYADIGLLLNARFELREDRLRNLRCQAADVNVLTSGCNAGFTPPTLNPQFDVRSGGVIGQRVHLNVDYNSQREFEASNDIQVYYQGLEDEVLRRVEVGNVTFHAPTSRFISGGIPSNNFGVQVQGQVGPLGWTGIFAQQKGNVVRGRTFTVGQQTLQPLDRQMMDRDYEPERFFFVEDPATLPGYPAVDILNLGLVALSPHQQVVQVRVYRRRSSTGQITVQQNLGGIPAVALRPDSPQRAGPFPWELLLEGRDYYLDPSGLWFALTNRLDLDDYLAVSYITAAGDTIGTFPAAARAAHVDTLRLIYEPRRGPDVPTFRYEMRNVYRVGGSSSVVRDGVQLRVLVNESERPAAGAATFLALLGIAQTSDQTAFDQFNRLFPRLRDPGAGAPLQDLFVVFPSLQPFADSTALPAQFRNDSLYRTPDYLLRTEGPTPIYTLALHYEATGGDDRGILSLGALQIRQGSEQLTANGRPLVRDVDYTINYEIGQVTFLHPDSLFTGPTTVTVQYEEQPAFAAAPTSIYGLQTTYDFGDHGTLTALGMLQQQATTFTRPPLGFEPQSNLIAGVSGNFRFRPEGLTRLLNRLPFVHTIAPSQVTLNAELATSRPSPNKVGTAWVETFEEEGGISLPLNENAWEYGSRPASPHGIDPATGLDPVAGFQDTDAVPLVWQNLIPGGTGVVQFTSQQIDPSIVTQGAGTTYETVLWFAQQPDTLGGLPDPNTGLPRWVVPHTPGPRWRSMTTALSATGMDLSRAEFLEFWVWEDPQRAARNAGTTLVFDFGRVYEDAVDFVPTSFTTTPAGDTVYTGRRRIGEGHLQTERDTLTGSWNAAIDDNGILGAVADSIFNATTGTWVHNMPLCESREAAGLYVYTWGNTDARCTRHNGAPDSDDLDNDGHLDTLVSAVQESYFRYVFHVGDQKYFVRDGGPVNPTTGMPDSSGGLWRLYRIPFRADTFQVGSPDIRQIRALRITVITPEQAGGETPMYFALSRVKLVGAPWLKRAETPIAGISGNQGTAHGEVIASIVSTENHADLGYTPPPGVVDQGATTTSSFSLGTTQINERSLRVIGRDVRVGERAEAYFQFPEGQRNFLGYRQLRVWARGRGGGWNDNELSFYVKVGQDQDNFYMYRTHVRTDTWLDAAVQFDTWLALRADIERRYLSGQPPSGAATCGGDSLAYVACDSTRSYVVHIRNPGVSPPNLAQVRELSAGFVRDSGAPADSAELWVDDIRLSQVVNTAGYAGAVNLHVVAADIADLTLDVSRRDAQFRQLGEDPSYVNSNQLSFQGTVRLERLGLERLGITAPFNVQVLQSSDDPYLLSGTDVVASGLAGLRRPHSSQTSYSLSLRRARRGTRWWQRWIVDNLGLAGMVSSGGTTTQLTQNSTSFGTLNADYTALPAAKSFRWVPGFLVRWLKSLPLLGRADFVQGLDGSRLRWSPATIRLSSGYTHTVADFSTFSVPIVTQSDSLFTRVHTITAAFRNQVGIELRPLESTSLGFDLASTRDLRDYGDSTTIGVLTRSSAQRLAGLNVGFEHDRTVNARLSWSPSLFSWLRPRLAVASSFALTRDPNGGTAERSVGDTAGAFRLPTTFTNLRSTDLGASFDLSRAMRSLLGEGSGLLPWFERVSPLDASWHLDLRSQFSRPGFDPGLGYQLGLGGIDAFRAQHGVPATAASRNTQARFATSLRLPAGLSVSGAFGEMTQVTWVRRGDGQAETRQDQRTWPDLTGRWVFSPGPKFLGGLISSVNASAAARITRAQTVQPPFSLQIGQTVTTTDEIRSVQQTRSWPLSLAVTWLRRISTSVTWTSSSGTDERAGNSTLTSHRDVSGDLSFSFRPPKEYLPLPSDIRTALRYSATSDDACLSLVGAESCLPVSQSTRRQYNFSMDTDMPPNVSAGLSIGYILTEDKHVDRKFSQLVITAAVTVNFQAGTLR